MNTGDLAYYTVDSLSAFWPGLQVLAGDVENAIKLHLLCEFACLHSKPRPPINLLTRQTVMSGSHIQVFQKSSIPTIASQLPINTPYDQVCICLAFTVLPISNGIHSEFIESTWYLYRVRRFCPTSIATILIDILFQATKDPFYLDVAERALFDLITRAKVKCGLTGISDLRTNKQDDRMESFVLSETLKVCANSPFLAQDTNRRLSVSVFNIRRREPTAR